MAAQSVFKKWHFCETGTAKELHNFQYEVQKFAIVLRIHLHKSGREPAPHSCPIVSRRTPLLLSLIDLPATGHILVVLCLNPSDFIPSESSQFSEAKILA